MIMKTGYMHTESFAGHRKTKVEILKETPKCYKVKTLEASIKGAAGTVLYAPKYSIEGGCHRRNND